MNRFWRLLVGNQWQQTRGKSSIKEVENSIPLRVLVMVLVILGIVATDIAGETQFSLWTVPLTMVGTWWSYYRRRSSNIPIQFCIAIGMYWLWVLFLGVLSAIGMIPG